MTPAWLRQMAEADLVDRTQYYLDQAGRDVAARFFDAAIDALQATERMPGTGSARVGELCHVPGLRVRRIIGFPCGWFYFIRADQLDVVRLLNAVNDE